MAPPSGVEEGSASRPQADIFIPSNEIGKFSSECERGTNRLPVGPESQNPFWELPSTWTSCEIVGSKWPSVVDKFGSPREQWVTSSLICPRFLLFRCHPRMFSKKHSVL